MKKKKSQLEFISPEMKKIEEETKDIIRKHLEKIDKFSNDIRALVGLPKNEVTK